MNTRPTSFFNKLSVFVAMTSHLHHGSVSVTLVAAFAALGSLRLLEPLVQFKFLLPVGIAFRGFLLGF